MSEYAQGGCGFPIPWWAESEERLREERPEMKACALLLEWIAEGEQGMPNPDTLADAVTFARLALK